MAQGFKVLAMFPGQGSQKVGMGAALCEQYPLARELFQCADQVLGFSLSDACFKGPQEQLTKTSIAQPAILTVSVICSRLALQEASGRFHLCAAAGHSLGEYSALVSAGAISFEDAVLLVHKRGAYMQEAVPQGTGKMFAVLGKELGEIEAAISKVSKGVVQIANVNAPGQIVVAGDVPGTAELAAILAGAKLMELAVSAPFHCALMEPAEKKLALDLGNLRINQPEFPVYANYSARPLGKPEEIREALRLQVCHRVRWVECIENALRDQAPGYCLEFGEGNVLSGLLKRIAPAAKRLAVNSPANLSELK